MLSSRRYNYITGIMSCHQTGGPIDCDISGRAYNRDFTVFDKYE